MKAPLFILAFLLLLAGEPTLRASSAPSSSTAAPPSAVATSPLAFLDFHNASNRSKAMQIAFIGMALALFVIVRNKH